MKRLELDFKTLGKKVAKIKRTYKILFSLVVNSLIFALLFYFVITPQIDTKQRLTTDLNKLNAELQSMVTVKNNMEKYRKEYAQLQEVLQQMLRELPETKDIPNLLRNVSSAGAEARLKITYFEPKAIQNKEFYAELPFSIRYNGPFHHVGYFFDSVRKLERIINITSFSLSLEPKSSPSNIVLRGDCTAKTYVYLKEQPKQQKK
jgi:type IV pilus assembly protein PilO